MIIILKHGATDEQVDHVIERIEAMGLQPHLSKGTYRTVIGVIGDEEKVQTAPLMAIPGVEEAMPVMPAYKLASREAHPQPTVVEVGSGSAITKLGGGHFGMIAGPCAVESAERLDEIAAAIKAAGANILRGGAFKPRTSPYSFQGLGEEGLKILREVGDKHGLPVVTEVIDPRHVELVAEYTDMIQLGARNMQNFVLLTEVGKTHKPVLMKRGMAATIKDLLMSAEYVIANGTTEVVLCERGVKGFDNACRNMLDIAAVPQVQLMSHLPIIVDPSHATGRPELIPACALAAAACGADGIHIEVHNCPEEAMSDGPQALLPEQYATLAAQIRKVAEAVGKTF
ncbi:3-deoxy-7-phosphoheptulonate synthase [Aeoliella mucimassa]|uniref:Phospho-2-dehydro-3-deoxyheptonate aldolase n=1 Tax=Aeoliella mucimassa TaxID=2527972 RepID=A0A518AT19_9BACT|nr:3-deoxy-7-phosphoheptulonate synthase [Aeoliella mucimassa]QDU57862.1 Phospho-2-dehydro-3-deoxyheptonate aldolase [Aeoliella mucimassa]